MRLTVIIRTLGVLFLLFSTTLLPPIGISLYYGDGELRHFSVTFAIALVARASCSGCRFAATRTRSAAATAS